MKNRGLTYDQQSSLIDQLERRLADAEGREPLRRGSRRKPERVIVGRSGAKWEGLGTLLILGGVGACFFDGGTFWAIPAIPLGLLVFLIGRFLG